jgi:hypothetical protein
MPSDIDFDPSNSDLQIGIELEYPIAESYDDVLLGRGHDSNDLLHRVDGMPPSINARAEYDGTVGLEVVSGVLDLADAQNWYRDVLEHIENEYGEPYQPVGLMSGGSTAGLHIHLSELSERTARQLQELSEEPWMQVLFCSSIANTGSGDVAWPVFRGGRYCQMNFGTGHYDCVNRRGGGHYEWRMPEPMIPEHIEILVKFLRLYEQSPDEAIQYAQELLDEGDNRITSIRRAEAIGMDLEGMPIIEREPAEEDPENFYERVADDWAAPQIYTVEYAGQTFYTFESRMDGEIEIDGVRFNTDDVLYADSLNQVSEADLADNVRRALNRRGEQRRETDATNELKKVLKKKKQ